MLPKWPLLIVSCAIAFGPDLGGGFYHHGRHTDFYGEYYRDRVGRSVYTYCYDARYKPKHRCRPRSFQELLSSPNYGPGAPPKDDGKSRYNFFDGRGNVNVGKGRYYRRGRDLVVECEFPRYDRLISNVVWYRKALRRKGSGNSQFRSDYAENETGFDVGFDYPDRHRIRVDNIGRHGSRLVIYNYRSSEDDGVYRCFTTRLRGGDVASSRSPSHTIKETVYMEIDVFSNKNALQWRWV